MKTYYDFLQEQLSDVKNTEVEPVTNLPKIFRLLCCLLNEESLGKEARWKVNCALAYLVNSEDVIDEDVYGAEGYMDDLYVCCLVLVTLMDDYKALIEKLWPESETVINDCYNRSEAFLDRKHMREDVVAFSRVLENRC